MKILSVFLCVFSLSLSTFSKPLKTHPDLKFECTYHFIQIAKDETVILDVIRSPIKNSIRFFHVKAGELANSLVKFEEQGEKFFLKESGDQIIGTSKDLSFDLKFDVKKSAEAFPKVGQSFVDLTAQDHPEVSYSGEVTFKGQTLKLTNGTLGTVSHHFGKALPAYAYFNSFLNGKKDHVIGVITLMPTVFGNKILGGYLVQTLKGNVQKFDTTNAQFDYQGFIQEPRDWTLTIKENFSNLTLAKYSVRVSDMSINQYDHEIDKKPTTTFFGTVITNDISGQKFSGVAEYRDIKAFDPMKRFLK